MATVKQKRHTDGELTDLARALHAAGELTVESLKKTAGGGDRDRLTKVAREVRAEQDDMSGNAPAASPQLPATTARLLDLLAKDIHRGLMEARQTEADRCRLWEDDLRGRHAAALAGLTDEVQAAKAEQESLSRLARENGEELSEAHARIAELDLRLAAQADERRRTQAATQSTTERMQAELVELRQEAALAREERLQACMERERAVARAERREEENAAALERLRTVEEEGTVLRQQAATFEADRRATANEIAALRARNTEMAVEVGSARDRIAAFEMQVASGGLMADLSGRLPVREGNGASPE
jgi:chromosome segregation ATPase